MANASAQTFPPGFWANAARQHPYFKIEPLDWPYLDIPVEPDQFWSDRYLNMEELLKDGAPAVLWKASPMASCHTGLRPKGESVKLFGAWWKLEKLTEAKLREEMELKAMVLDFGHTYSGTLPSMRPHRANVLELLTKAVDAAIRSGISAGDIHSIVDTRIIVTTMTD